MNILVACEESQAVTKELRTLGHRAFSADIQKCSGGHPEWHILGDVIPLLNGQVAFKLENGETHAILGKWDLIIAHPPCTYLTNAGARWLYKGGQLNNERYNQGLNAKKFFECFLNADCDRIAIENPIPSKIYGLPKYTQIIQPYQFGHKVTKKTCLWLKGLPKLEETNNIGLPEKEYFQKKDGTWRTNCWTMKQTKDRAKNRSKTFPGIAKAMATQWTKEEQN